MSNVLNILCKATLTGRVAAIRYNGQHHIRIIEPHVIYISKDGIIHFDCYQTRCQIGTGADEPVWRTYQLMNIDSIYLLNDTFKARIDEGFVPTKARYKGGLIAMVNAPTTTNAPPVQDNRSERISEERSVTKEA